MYLIVVLLFVAVLASLGSGLGFLLKSKNDKSNSKRLAQALTLRIGLSVLLFVLLIVAWRVGLIHPHGIMPGS
ncbi:MAG TPA: twin transmembrane helix small protein [Gammaproteobacteria bacterium]|nr:twin transmembrane helix small protein [Gammaproteobacteria bacterium]